jgi:hypothetical protein
MADCRLSSWILARLTASSVHAWRSQTPEVLVEQETATGPIGALSKGWSRLVQQVHTELATLEAAAQQTAWARHRPSGLSQAAEPLDCHLVKGLKDL